MRIDWSKQLRFRFGLRHILIVFVLIAIASTLLFATSTIVAIPWLFVITIALPAVLTAGIVYFEGSTRAFCIGGLFPAGASLCALTVLSGLLLFDRVDGMRNIVLDRYVERLDPEFRIYCAFIWFLTVVIGTLVLFVQWLGEQSNE